ncbi:GNAT family N-acetyltransferase [Streptomyces sp. NPDC056930]|uniref:GNAT family N-acetyltransferase n=1 Tax=Streptomyces sp. NPDC056930 TaxID=3345967 RepID=UPI0036292F78
MRRDLATCPPPTDWSSRVLGNGLRAVPCDRHAGAVFPAWRAAFPASHPDHHRGSDEEALNDVFRRPEPRYAGLGADLLRRVLGVAAADGPAGLSLVVSDANPARRVYERLGFRLTDTSLTVVVP